MRTILIAVAAAAVLASPASAATFDRSRLAGAELHRNAHVDHVRRWETWRLHQDGRLSGNWHSQRPAADAIVEEFGKISGRWMVENGKLCVDGSGLNHAGKHCFALTKGGQSAKQYKMMDRGAAWDVFIYTRPGISSAERR